MPRIKDSAYRQFLDTGIIELIDTDVFQKGLDKVDHPHKQQARALLILLYYSGARPSEALDLPAADVKTEGKYIKILFPTKKRGRARIVYLPKNPHIKEFYEYVKPFSSINYNLFWAFKSKHKKLVRYTTGKGPQVRAYIDTTSRLRYWFKRWLGLTPYFLRHNRFSSMSLRGASAQEIAFVKGSRDLKSAMIYIHLSTKQARRTARFIK